MSRQIIFVLVLASILSACAPTPATQTSEVTQTSDVLPTSTSAPSSTPEPPTATPTATPIPLPAEVLAVLAGQEYSLVDDDANGTSDRVVIANGDTLFRYVPEADRINGQEWQRMQTFTLTDGEKLEMPRFETLDDALLYIAKHALWRTGGSSERFQALDFWTSSNNPKAIELAPIVKKIPERKFILGCTIPEKGKNFTLLNVDRVGNDSMLIFEGENGDFALVFVAGDVEAGSHIFWESVEAISTPQP